MRAKEEGMEKCTFFFKLAENTCVYVCVVCVVCVCVYVCVCVCQLNIHYGRFCLPLTRAGNHPSQ